MGRSLIYLSLAAILGLAVWAASYMWTSIETDMPPAGWFALGAGIVVSLVLGAVLMGITFYSSRQGYDDRVGTRAFRSSEER